MSTTTWARLRRGDVIVCPTTGRAERVEFNRPSGRPGHRFVRTSSHDHPARPGNERVEVRAATI